MQGNPAQQVRDAKPNISRSVRCRIASASEFLPPAAPAVQSKCAAARERGAKESTRTWRSARSTFCRFQTLLPGSISGRSACLAGCQRPWERAALRLNFAPQPALSSSTPKCPCAGPISLGWVSTLLAQGLEHQPCSNGARGAVRTLAGDRGKPASQTEGASCPAPSRSITFPERARVFPLYPSGRLAIRLSLSECLAGGCRVARGSSLASEAGGSGLST
ncbi:hypothetical protein AAFF_G00175700 [Aldrovandia affinis]|uniref:Uncharacterized protein n=1 Tax=Aldrovandia affinis TaxID=143900 RepID=A0AAD7W7H8_9TELE|nr:hypothetical protein AAFF_G00175700 [Aldrovandia affinis]